ncbi:oligosaccharide flippase family protein [Roseovarius sp. S88]|uniref:Oligosaccharide flippase family protein n=2 Tax=Roseovarius phycicola TaxID=3080976 RepID=A0ABZ2HJY2_9RHOB
MAAIGRSAAGSETLRAGGAAGIMISIRVLGAFGTLAYTVILARMLSPQDFGLVWTLWSGAFIAAYLSTLNIGATAIREVVRARASGNDAAAAGFVIVSRRVLLLACLPVVATFLGLIWFRNPDMAESYPIAVLMAAAMIPVMGWNATNAAQAVALDKVLRSQVPGMVLRPLVFCVVLGCAWLIGISVSLEIVVGLYLSIVGLIAMVQFVLLRRFFDFMRNTTPDTKGWQRWITTGLLLAPNRLLTDRLRDVLLLVAAIPLGAVGVAQMAVALSVVTFLSFAVNAVETSFAPKISRSIARALSEGDHAHEDPRTLHFIAISGALKLGLMAAGAAVLWLFMPLVIRLFGSDYAASEAVIWWVFLIPLASAFFGNTALVMQLFDKRRAFFLTSVAALLTLVAVGISVVPMIVALGHDALIVTAAGFAVTMIALQAVRWALCRITTGIDVSAIGALARWYRHMPTHHKDKEVDA